MTFRFLCEATLFINIRVEFVAKLTLAKQFVISNACCWAQRLVIPNWVFFKIF